MGDREDRIAQNEAVFRLMNERTLEVLAEMGAPDDEPRPLEIVCECGDASCTTTIMASPAEYERARSDPRWFLVAHGHEVPDVESVIDDRPDHLLVEKHASEDEIARATDPRG
jgi:hypothetical protein